MKTIRLSQAITEARRFLERAEPYCTDLEIHGLEDSRYEDGKQTAAIRRASLDLTRALADLRRPAS
jgi:hypothetical protein